MQVKKQQLEPYMEQKTGSKLGKEYVKAVYCHPAYLPCRVHHVKSRTGWSTICNWIVGRDINNLKWYNPYSRKLRGIKQSLDEGERGEWKAGLKLNIQKTKIIAFSRITSWQIDGETMEIVTDFTFLNSKITVDSDYSHEIKACLLLGRKAMTNLKSKDITLPTKVHVVTTMVFPIVK